MTKNVSVDTKSMQEKEEEEKTTEVVKEEEEEYNQMKNEMIFFLSEAPEYQISAVGEWCENAKGEVVGSADTYFLHILTGQRCESAWSCLVGFSECDEHTTEKWETLCFRIGKLENIEEYICDEKRVGV